MRKDICILTIFLSNNRHASWFMLMRGITFDDLSPSDSFQCGKCSSVWLMIEWFSCPIAFDLHPFFFLCTCSVNSTVFQPISKHFAIAMLSFSGYHSLCDAFVLTEVGLLQVLSCLGTRWLKRQVVDTSQLSGFVGQLKKYHWIDLFQSNDANF